MQQFQKKKFLKSESFRSNLQFLVFNLQVFLIIAPCFGRLKVQISDTQSLKIKHFFSNSHILINFYLSYFDVVWEYLGVLITTLSLICFVSELFSILGLFLARPISLTEKQSKLLNAAGVDFVRQKPKPTIVSNQITVVCVYNDTL